LSSRNNKSKNKRPRTGRPQSGQSADRHVEDRRRPRFSRELPILFEDEAVIVVNKPAGMLAVPIKGSDTPSALSLLSEKLKPKKQRPWVVHRIDRFASGILMFAKTSRDREFLVRQFLDHVPQRHYLAVVRGHLKSSSGTLVHYFRRAGMFQQLRAPRDPDATRAELRYRLDRQLPSASVVRVDLVTGLQNQIRAQFAAIGNPVVGDRKYHPAEASEPLIDRVALHAARLTFQHPRSGEPVHVEAPLPKDIQTVVRELSRKHT
jgi:23S rRNA pseudouridine1911/1915/1917 synthase